MNTSEIEFINENCMISIIPNFSLDVVQLISGNVGPFRPGLSVEVPLWLAVNLRQRRKCRILPPEWMDIEKLTELKEAEKSSKVFTKMPSEEYIMLTQTLLSVCGEDIAGGHEIKTLVKDIWDIRSSKLRSSVTEFIRSAGTHAKLDNLTLQELNENRAFLCHAMDDLGRFAEASNLGKS